MRARFRRYGPPMERGLCIIDLETRNEPSCVSDNTFAIASVCTMCVLALLPPFTVLVLARCDRLGELRMTVCSCRLDLTFCAHLMSDGSGSHCKMMPESPRQFSFFTAYITANVSVAPFISTTVDMPYPTVFPYMLTTFSPSVASTIFETQCSQISQLRGCRR